jgi:nickel-dependent lactate racemase
MVRLGVSRFGNEVWVNRDFMQAKIKILTGFIEPHFFAGFSGGPKSVLLGVGAFESILRNHSAPMIDNPMFDHIEIHVAFGARARSRRRAVGGDDRAG